MARWRNHSLGSSTDDSIPWKLKSHSRTIHKARATLLVGQPIEYAMSEEEKGVHAGKLQDKVINLGIRELSIFGTKLRARGRIVGLVGK